MKHPKGDTVVCLEPGADNPSQTLILTSKDMESEKTTQFYTLCTTTFLCNPLRYFL